MMNLRAASAILLASVLSISASSATLLLPVDQPDALSAWALDQPDIKDQSASTSADLALEVARQALTLSASGDVDADGVDDLIFQSVDLNNGFTLISAVSGGDALADAGVEETIWRLAPNQGSVTQIVGDIDGDAVADLVISQSIGGGSAQMQGAGDAAVGTAEAQGAVLFQTVDGASATGELGVELATSLQKQSAGITGQVGLGAEKVTETLGHVQATGTDSLHQIEQRVETSQAMLLQELPLDALTSVEADAVLTVLDASGEVRGTIMLEDPGVNPLSIAAPDLDLDGLSDTVLIEVQKVSPAQEGSTIVPTISAYTGASMDLAWEVQMDPLAGLPLLIPDVGDMNGDGHVELAYHAISSVPGSDPSGTVLVILDGASGEILSQTEVAEGLLVAAPLGGDISGDASAEVLLLEGTAQAITQVSVAGQDLDAIWTIDIPEDAAPINLVTNEFTGAAEGLRDLTGDGVPDLGIASGFFADPLTGELTASATGQADDLVLEVYSGVDGELVWSETLTSALSVSVLSDMGAQASANASGQAGVQASDVIAIIEGEAATALDSGFQKVDGLSLLLMQARDGAGILRLPLLEPGLLADLGGDVAATADVQSAGDVDADGTVDVLVRVEAVLEGADNVDVQHVQGQLVAATEQAIDQVYVISGRTGEVIEAQMETSEAVETTLAADASAHMQARGNLDGTLSTGDVEQLEAYGTASSGEEVSTPGFGLVSALAILGAAILALRRRA